MAVPARVTRRSLLKMAVAAIAAGLGGAIWERSRPVPDLGGELSAYRESGPTRQSLPVAIVRGDDPVAMVRSAVSLAGGLRDVIAPGATVLIKPNLTIPSASGRGNVTDSRVVAATIELCREAGAGRIIVADGSGGGDTTQIMQLAGYEPLLRAKGVSFVDLNNDEVVTRRLADPDGLVEYALAKTAAEAGVLISVAVLKVHHAAIVTLACKNLIGIASRRAYGRPRSRLHDAGVQKVTADLVRLCPPAFAIVDGTVGLEGDSPMNGVAVPMNLVVAGRNPVSVDAVGAAIMGFDPRQLEQLTLLAKRGYGEIDPEKIEIKGTSIAAVQRKFRR